MTGLVGRAFAWPMLDANMPLGASGGQMYPITQNPWFRWNTNNNNPGGNKIWKIPTILTEAMVWYRQKEIGGQVPFWRMFGYDQGDSNVGAVLQGEVESWFIKKWRGVTRLAIVDVDDELSISVPPFDPDDFSYIDSAGNQIAVPGVQSRIDLIFIYSKPIDSSGVKLMKSSSVDTITRPQLGIVRGAGIHTTEESTGNALAGGLRRPTSNEHKIIASPADQYNSNMGFTSTSANDIEFDVRGSFPAPDDILNIAPLLSEKLESEAYELLGQSILPVAYVWVQNSGSQDSGGTIVIDPSDVIDIRPLMRTAELAYNERAGIAAAVPQISLANPVVSRVNLDYESLQIYNYINSQFTDDSGGGGGGGTSTAGMPVLAAGYVFGGYNFGPEGALWDFYKTRDGTDDATTRDNIRLWYYGQNATNPPMYPDWDEAYWVDSKGVTDGGKYPNDYINTFLSQGKSDSAAPYKNDPSIVGGSYTQQVFDNGTTTAGTGGSVPTRIVEFGAADVGANLHSFNPRNRVQFHYIQKKIIFANSLPSWLHDYTVEVDLVNCLPETFFGTSLDHGELPLPAGYVGHWVEKTREYFTIYIAFAARHTERNPIDEEEPPKTNPELPWKRRSGGLFSSFVVPVQDLLKSNLTAIPQDKPSGYKAAGGSGYAGNPRIGICTYPTVSWTVTGVPLVDLKYFYSNLNGTDPQITLKS